MYQLFIMRDFGFAECAVLSQTDCYSLAGEFFPEAAQIAYKMWELSAMTKVKVCSFMLHVLLSSMHLNYLLALQ